MHNQIYIRNETNTNEYRTPIVPKDVPILIQNGFIVYIETSNHRIFLDEEYEKQGAIITNKPWYDASFQNTWIVGLKEMNQLEKLSNHKHVFFSHSYKNQIGSQTLLTKFAQSNSIIYDFEFFLDEKNKRIISFGFYAGIVGCLLGLLQYIHKTIYNINISNLNYWSNIKDVITMIRTDIFKNCRIGIVGPNGNCGKGVQYILNMLDIDYHPIKREDNKSNLKEFDILYNCITLDNSYNEIWFDKNMIFNKSIILCDISCDYSKPNNPIQIYNKATSWENPVYNYNDFVDIIAINNLPSLLPKESSIYFSEKCSDLFLEVENETWKKNEQIFFDTLFTIGSDNRIT